MTEPTPSLQRPNLGLMLLISLIQGFALFLLWRAAANEVWPSQTPAVNFPLWSVAITLPLLLLLGLESEGRRRTAVIVTLFCSALALFSAYVGWQATPFGEFPFDSIVAVHILSSVLGCFLALLFLRSLTQGEKPNYAKAFSDSWRNALVAALAAALAFGVAAVLMLWGALFQVIGIDFFMDLFSEDWFLFPLLSVVVGLGIFIFRGFASVIGGIASLFQGLMWLLLPLALMVTALFLGALPFTGLQPLWDTGNGTFLLMSLNVFALFAVNAVYQADEREPYPLLLHRTLSISLLLLPLISLLALYGLYLRIDQYGWTVARCWAFLVVVLITLFSCGYAGNVLRFREGWAGKLAYVNLPMSLMMLAAILLSQTPLLDFRKISLASQQGRVERGEITLDEFDFFDARADMGRPAWLWMQELIAENRDSNPELAQLVLDPVRRPIPAGASGRIDFAQRATFRPEPFAFPEGLGAAMQASPITIRALRDAELELVVFRVDLDGDGAAEYVLAANPEEGILADGFRLEDGGDWQRLRLAPRSSGAATSIDLAAATFEAVTPPFADLRIGDVELQVRPEP